jgi:gliding motility-associated protein GldM
MAGAKLSPRQRMIGMMYLVLTALLALNVSKEIINAFVTVNDSLEASNKNTTSRNERIYADFKKAMENDPAKAGEHNTRAQNTKKLCAELNTYIDGLKKDITVKVEKLEAGAAVPAPRDIARKDDYDVPTNIMCGDKAMVKDTKLLNSKTRSTSSKQMCSSR